MAHSGGCVDQAGGGTVKHKLGDCLRHYRVCKNLSLRKLEAETGISNAVISQYENGQHKPSFINVAKLAAALDFSLDDLAKDIGEVPR